MRIRHLPIILGCVVTGSVALVHPARADVIDGEWCSADGRQLSIHGPAIVTPGGTRMQGAYTRHSFAYTVPASEPRAGDPVSMLLRNETTVEIRTGPAERPSEIWHRCTATS